jgi:hypothetical protein
LIKTDRALIFDFFFLFLSPVLDTYALRQLEKKEERGQMRAFRRSEAPRTRPPHNYTQIRHSFRRNCPLETFRWKLFRTFLEPGKKRNLTTQCKRLKALASSDERHGGRKPPDVCFTLVPLDIWTFSQIC